METLTFHESLDNIESSSNFSYLLNFWHISKLNKEFEFIKRHGMHPALVPTDSNKTNDMRVTEGNSVDTYFYTSFRIFLKALFEGAEAFKTRDIDEWKITYKNEESKLDNLNYLIYKYHENTFNSQGIIRKVSTRGYLRNTENFLIKLEKKDQLHGKVLLDTLSELQENAKTSVDGSIVIQLNDITKKIAKMLNIEEPVPPMPRVAKKAKKIVSPTNELSRIENQVFGTPAQEQSPPSEGPEVTRELLPIYHELKNSITMFSDRTKFSYILNYAKQGSTNVVINNIIDNDHSYRQFMTITNNMTL